MAVNVWSRIGSSPRPLGWALLLCVLVARLVAAQGAAAGIRGKVVDDTGASLPGVTVTMTSPGLLAARSATTEPDGTYAFIDIPTGEYSATFELQGFQRLVRQQIQLTVGFTATIDATLKIGTVQESITVSGASPVVDTTSTTP